jgi:hypothetical protein
LRRLRKYRPLKNKFPFLVDSNYTSCGGAFSIVYHKVDDLNESLAFIKHDHGLMKADILIISCKSIDMTCSISIDEFNLAKIIMKESKNMLIYVRLSHLEEAVFVHDNSDQNYAENENANLEVGLIFLKVQKVFICYLHNSQTEFHQFRHSFNAYFIHLLSVIENDQTLIGIKDYLIEKLFLIGTIGYDAKKKEESEIPLNFFQREMKLMNLFTASTSDDNKQLDWCLSNSMPNQSRKEFEAMAYESIFSQHKPIWLTFFKTELIDDCITISD